MTSLTPNLYPKHIAIIMDGNGRWAQARGLPRTEGHIKGVEVMRSVLESLFYKNIPYITLFGFSSENWRRPKSEVGFLINLLEEYAKRELQTLHQHNVRIKILGRRDNLDKQIVKTIEHVEARTKNNHKLFLQVAFNYGAKDELTNAAARLAHLALKGKLNPDKITQKDFANALWTRGIPDPDLILRTSGEQRISNFLLWQSAYSELIFTDVLWPDFKVADLDKALDVYAKRKRRFGGIKEESEESQK